MNPSIVCWPLRWRRAIAHAFGGLLLVLLVFGAAWANDPPIPAFSNWVVDTTDTLDTATVYALSERLSALEQETAAQVAVLMISSTEDENIESYATRVFEQWGLGRKGADNGILLLVAKDDRRLRIEVGYGLEGVVPDLLAGRIIREQINPRFQTGQYAQGIAAGVDALITLVQGEPLPESQRGNADQSLPERDAPWVMLAPLAFMALMMPLGLATLAIGVFAGIAFNSVLVGLVVALGAVLLGALGGLLGFAGRQQSIAASRRGRGSLHRYGGFGGGGFGGGGFGGGGFGGGGGGSSGGGGASGSW